MSEVGRSEEHFHGVRKYFTSFFEPNNSRVSQPEVASRTPSRQKAPSFGSEKKKSKREKYFSLGWNFRTKTYTEKPQNSSEKNSPPHDNRHSLRKRISRRSSFFGTLTFRSQKKPWLEYPALSCEPELHHDHTNTQDGSRTHRTSRVFSRYTIGDLARKFFLKRVNVSHADMEEDLLSDTSVPSTTSYYPGSISDHVNYLNYPDIQDDAVQQDPIIPEMSSPELYARFLDEVRNPPNESFEDLKACSPEKALEVKDGNVSMKSFPIAPEALAEQHFSKPWTMSGSHTDQRSLQDVVSGDENQKKEKESEEENGKEKDKEEEEKAKEEREKKEREKEANERGVGERNTANGNGNLSRQERRKLRQQRKKLRQEAENAKRERKNSKLKRKEMCSSPKSYSALSTSDSGNDSVNFITKSFPDGTNSNLDTYLRNWKPKVPEKPPIGSLYDGSLLSVRSGAKNHAKKPVLANNTENFLEEKNKGVNTQVDSSLPKKSNSFPKPSDPNIDSLHHTTSKKGYEVFSPRKNAQFGGFSTNTESCGFQCGENVDPISLSEASPGKIFLQSPSRKTSGKLVGMNAQRRKRLDFPGKRERKRVLYGGNKFQTESDLKSWKFSAKEGSETVGLKKVSSEGKEVSEYGEDLAAQCGFQIDYGQRSFEDELVSMQERNQKKTLLLSHSCKDQDKSNTGLKIPISPKHSSKNTGSVLATPKECFLTNEPFNGIILAESTPQNSLSGYEMQDQSSEYEPSCSPRSEFRAGQVSDYFPVVSTAKNSLDSIEVNEISDGLEEEFLAASSFLATGERDLLEEEQQKCADPFYRPCASVSSKNLFYDYELDSKSLSKDSGFHDSVEIAEFDGFRSFSHAEIYEISMP